MEHSFISPATRSSIIRRKDTLHHAPATALAWLLTAALYLSPFTLDTVFQVNIFV